MQLGQEKRLQFLDVLRGIAALSVMIEHMGERLFPEFVHFTSTYFQLGQFGVILFFLCSGFIIPHSLERSKQLKTFWIRRFFRLYPLYWVNLTLALILAYYIDSIDNPTFSTVIANMTMVQKFLGQPDVIGLYWTLNIEMLFYIICSLLFVLRLFQRTILIILIFFILTLISSSSPILGFHIPGWGMFFNLFTMFMGTIMHRFYTRQINTGLIKAAFSLSFILILSVCTNVFLHDNNPQFLGTHSFIPMLMSWTTAYFMFFLLLRVGDLKNPRTLCFLGTISYSIYLMHPLIIELIPTLPNMVLSLMLWGGITIGVATVTYFGIEKPFVALGRRLTIPKHITNTSTSPIASRL